MATQTDTAAHGAAQQKFCTKCSQTKPITDYTRDKSTKDGLCFYCRDCRKAYGRNWYASLPQERKTARIDYEAMAKYRAANRDAFRARSKKWTEENKDKHRANTKAAMRRMRATAKGRLSNNVSRAVHRALKGKKNGEPAFNILGYTVQELMAHVEARFLPGMTWENYGKWHLDHIIPLAVHNYEKPTDPDFRKAWALTNLRPLWAKDNIVKGARLSAPFQPSLAIGE